MSERDAMLLNDHICIHHTDAERASIRCPICLRTTLGEKDAQIAALREAMLRSAVALHLFRRAQGEKHRDAFETCEVPACEEARRLAGDTATAVAEYVARVQAEEREACANLCDDEYVGLRQIEHKQAKRDQESVPDTSMSDVARGLAAAIRARGDPPGRPPKDRP